MTLLKSPARNVSYQTRFAGQPSNCVSRNVFFFGLRLRHPLDLKGKCGGGRISVTLAVFAAVFSLAFCLLFSDSTVYSVLPTLLLLISCVPDASCGSIVI